MIRGIDGPHFGERIALERRCPVSPAKTQTHSVTTGGRTITPPVAALQAHFAQTIRFGNTVPRWQTHDSPEKIAHHLKQIIFQNPECFLPEDPESINKAYTTLAQNGIIAASIPGESMVSATRQVALIQALFQVNPSHAAWRALNSVVAAWPIAQLGSPKQQQHWLPPILAGQNTGSIALMEQVRGDSIQHMEPTATWNAVTRQWVVNSGPLLIPNGKAANSVVFLAKTLDDLGEWVDVGFVIPNVQDHPGVIQLETDVASASAPLRVRFDNLTLPPENQLGDKWAPGSAMAVARDTLQTLRMNEAASKTGLLANRFDKTFFYAASMTGPHDARLNNPNVYSRLSRIARDLFAAKALTTQAAEIREKEALACAGSNMIPAKASHHQVLNTAAAAYVAQNALDSSRQQIEAVLKDVRLSAPASTLPILALSAPEFSTLSGTPDMLKLVVARQLRESIVHAIQDLTKRQYRIVRWIVGDRAEKSQARSLKRLKRTNPQTPLALAEHLYQIGSLLFNQTLHFSAKQHLSPRTKLFALHLPETALHSETTRPMVEDARVMFPLADMAIAVEKLRATLTQAKAQDGNPMASLFAKQEALDAINTVTNRMEHIYQMKGKTPKVAWLMERLPHYRLIGGNEDDHNRAITEMTLKHYREAFKTPEGQAYIRHVLDSTIQSPQLFAQLEKAVKKAGRPLIPFIPSQHRNSTIRATHLAYKVLAPNLFKIQSVDFPAQDATLLRNLTAKHQVILAPHHPSGEGDIIVEWGLLGRSSPQDGPYLKPLFMAKHELFSGALKRLLPQLGAFSVVRGGETDTSMAYLAEAAKTGNNVIIIHPRGEAEYLTHHVLPFRYGTANAAVATALSGEAKKPVTIAPLAFAFLYTQPVQQAVEGRLHQLEKCLNIPTPEEPVFVSTADQAQRMGRALEVYVTQVMNDLNAATAEQGPITLPDTPLLNQIEWLKQQVLDRLERKYYGKIQPNSVLTRMRRLSEDLKEKAEVSITQAQRHAIETDRQLARFERDFTGFAAEAYGHLGTLTQDQFCELLLRLEEALKRPGIKPLHKPAFEFLGPRRVVARLTEPIQVDKWLKEHQDEYQGDPKEAARLITRMMEQRMQEKINEILAESVDTTMPQYPNPMI